MMKKIPLFYALLLIMISFHSCGNSENDENDENIPVLDLSKIETESAFSIEDLIDSVRFVSLETKRENLIGEVTKIVIVNDIIYILDRRYTNSIYVFDIEGKYLFKINRLGRGPGEYIEIDDFLVSQHFIEIYDHKQRKIIYYNNNGKFDHEINVGFLGSSFYKSGNNYLFYSEGLPTKHDLNAEYGLIAIDVEGELIKNFYPYEAKYNNNFVPESKLVFFDNNLFAPNFSEFVYEINDITITKAYKINRGKHDFDLSELSDDVVYFGETGAIYHIYNFFKTDKYILLNYQYRSGFALYDINTLELKRSGKYLESTSKTKGFGCYPEASYKNSLVSVLSEGIIRNQLEATNLNEDDYFKKFKNMPYINPVLMFYTLN